MMTEKEMRAYLEGEGFSKQDFIDHAENFLVEAGAGAGKTTIMVKRIVNQLVTEYCQPEEIVAITFTNKSTLELRERLDKLLEERREALEKKLEKTGALTQEEEKTLSRLEYLIRESGRMQVSTIHSFCRTMLESMPFASPLGLDMQMMEDEEIYAKRFLRRRMRENYSLFRKARDIGVPVYMLQKFFVERCNNNEAEIQYCADETQWDSWIQNDIKPAAIALQAKLAEIVEQHPSEPYDYMHTGVKKLAQMDAAAFAADESAIMQLAWQSLRKPDKCPARWDATTYYKGKFQESVFGCALTKVWGGPKGDALRNATAPLVHSYIMQDMDALLKDFRAEKHKKHLATFNDLLLRTRDMLRDKEDARAYFHQRYKVIYVDEMQDTDPVQTEMLFYLTSEAKDINRKDWKKCKPVPGSLFLVGDPKQAIYRFRGADIGVYNILLQLFAADGAPTTAATVGKKVSLQYNFRSTKEICALTDQVFKPSAQNPADYQFVGGKYHAEYMAMESQATPCDRTRLVRYQLEDGEKKQDPEHVALFIYTMIALGLPVGIDDPEHKKYVHAAQPKDFLVLTKGKAAPQKYADALMLRGIPAEVSGENEFEEKKNDKYSMFERAAMHLRSLLSPRDDRLVIKILRECYRLDYRKWDPPKKPGGKSTVAWEATVEQRIHKLLTRAGAKSLTGLLYPKQLAELRLALEAENDPQNWDVLQLCTALEEIAALRQMVKTKPAMAVIEHLLEGGYGVWQDAETNSPADRRQWYSKMLQFLNLVRKCRERSFPALAAYTIECVEKSYEHELTLLPAKNVVRIMNLHKAKGLEGEVVILAHSVYSDPIPKVHVVRKEGEPTREFVALHPAKPDGYDFEHAVAWPKSWLNRERPEEKKFGDAEYARLLYVAATRAKTMLVVCGDPDVKPGGSTNPVPAPAVQAPAQPAAAAPAGTAATQPTAAAAAAPAKTAEEKASYWYPLLEYLTPASKNDPIYGSAFQTLVTGVELLIQGSACGADPDDTIKLPDFRKMLNLGEDPVEEDDEVDEEPAEVDEDSAEEDDELDLSDADDYVDDDDDDGDHKPKVYTIQPVQKETVLQEVAASLAESEFYSITPSRLNHGKKAEKKEQNEDSAKQTALPQSEADENQDPVLRDDPTISAEEAAESESPCGSVWGTIVHQVMELAVRDGSYQAESVKQFARRAICDALASGEMDKSQRLRYLHLGEEDDDETVISKLMPWVMQASEFLMNPDSGLRKLVDGAAVYPEMPFFLQIKKDDAKTQELYDHLQNHIDDEAAGDRVLVVEGVIDLAVLKNNCWTVVDYKTDRIKKTESQTTYEQRLKDEYTAQIASYTRVLAQITGKQYPVTKAYLCSIPLDGYLVELDI